jgi:hypothetical protein
MEHGNMWSAIALKYFQRAFCENEEGEEEPMLSSRWFRGALRHSNNVLVTVGATELHDKGMARLAGGFGSSGGSRAKAGVGGASKGPREVRVAADFDAAKFYAFLCVCTVEMNFAVSTKPIVCHLHFADATSRAHNCI